MSNKIEVEIEDTAKVFRFRLTDGVKHSKWVGYQGIARMGNVYAATQYYLSETDALKPQTAETILNSFATE